MLLAIGLSFGTGAGATDTTVVDVPTRDATQRFLYMRADAPVANVVFLPGRDGIVNIQKDGSLDAIIGRCAPFWRNREALASRGLSVALVDRTSDDRVRQYADVVEVARYMRGRDAVPTVIAGGSGSTSAAIEFAIAFPPDEALALVVFSPYKPKAARAALVKRPTLVVHHAQDAQSTPYAEPLLAALTAAPRRADVALQGGNSEGCGHHLFAGVDAAFVDAVAGFVAGFAASR